MYSDLSVTVSAGVVRAMDKALSCLVLIEEGYIPDPAKDPDAIAKIADAVAMLEKLFVYRDETLIDQGEYAVWMCRKLDWLEVFSENVENNYKELVEEFVQTGTDAGRKLVEQGYWEEEDISYLTQTCQDLSESIWCHFEVLHHLVEYDA